MRFPGSSAGVWCPAVEFPASTFCPSSRSSSRVSFSARLESVVRRLQLAQSLLLTNQRKRCRAQQDDRQHLQKGLVLANAHLEPVPKTRPPAVERLAWPVAFVEPALQKLQSTFQVTLEGNPLLAFQHGQLQALTGRLIHRWIDGCIPALRSARIFRVCRLHREPTIMSFVAMLRLV